MKRLGEFNNKVIVEQEKTPENKYVIWKDPSDNTFKEWVDGSWVESPNIAAPGGGGGGDFPYEYVCPDDFSATVQYEDWENLDSEPYCEIHIDEIDIPEDARYYYCVNGAYGYTSGSASVKIGSGKQYITVDAYPLIDDNKLSGFAFRYYEDGETIIQQASPITFNFTDMTFIGKKKSE